MTEAAPPDQLVAQVLAELEWRHYAKRTQALHRQFYQRFLRYAATQGLREYSVEVGIQLFETAYQCRYADLTPPIPDRLVRPLQYLAALSDLQLHGPECRRYWRTTPCTHCGSAG